MRNVCRRFAIRLARWRLFLLGGVLALILGHPFSGDLGGVAVAQDNPSAQWVQAGVEAYQQGEYSTAVSLWQRALTTLPAQATVEQALVNANLARAYQQLGLPSDTIRSWEAAAAAYRQLGETAQVGRMLTEQAQVYLRLGQHRRAIALLCLPKAEANVADCESGTALPIATTTQDDLGRIAALGSLGEAYRLRGDYAEAESFLREGLDLARATHHPQLEAPILQSLGSLFSRRAQIEYRRATDLDQIGLSSDAAKFFAAAQDWDAQALQWLEAALSLTQPPHLGTEWQTRLSLLPIYQRQQNGPAVTTTRQRLAALMEQLPASREVAYGAITLGKSFQPVGSTFECAAPDRVAEAQRWLEKGVEIAVQIADRRAESFALGELGHLYACQGDFAAAMAFTQQAQVAASESLGSADSLYLWQWQAGKLYQQQQQFDQALAAYEQAVATLETIRTEILVADQDVQFDFRDTVDPLYRELIEMQLAAVSPPETVANKQLPTQPLEDTATALESALLTADSLRLAELQNYFGNDCILSPVAQNRVDLLAQSTNTAVISSIILPERTGLIATIPGQTPQLIWVNDSQQLRATVNQFRRSLEAFYTEPYDTAWAEQLYGQMIRPLEPFLAAANIQTLVFVQDGFLRSVPMTALYDGRQFLIEKYAIATTPALTLTAPQQAQADRLRALVMGSSQEVAVEGRVFDPLPNVAREVQAVLSALPGSQALLDSDFSRSQLQQALKADRYSILHFATHGQFSPNPEENFILTGQGEKVTFGQLESLIQTGAAPGEPLDLVMLTACDTGIGDDRSTLGLAGVAIRAGARSAIASLWQADDFATAEVIQAFYQFLKDPNLNKAQALQQAQIQALRQSPSMTPGKWAPLILVGNWL